MKDTWFYLTKDRVERLVQVQQRVNGKWDRYPVIFYEPDFPIKGAKSFFSGGGGLTSTAKDYANFLQMYLNGGNTTGEGS
jgi:CubicO group peptidase (beta-lactamase class C family)